jgi:hypothetical protein
MAANERRNDVRWAFEKTWATSREETSHIEVCPWIAVSDTLAACVYKFTSSGMVDGRPFVATG